MTTRTWSCLLFVLLAGCVSPPPPERFHTLLPAEPAAAAASAPAGAETLHVDVTVTVPPQVDRTQWVVRQPDESLRVLEQERWAAPLPDELRGALVERLASRWGALDVRGVASLPAPLRRVRVDVQRFESVPGHEARLDAVWSLSGAASGAAPTLCRQSFVEIPAGADANALAAAHRRAVVRLADTIGARLRAPAQDSAC